MCLDVWKGSGVEKKDEEQRVGIEVLLYEASLGGRLESKRYGWSRRHYFFFRFCIVFEIWPRVFGMEAKANHSVRND